MDTQTHNPDNLIFENALLKNNQLIFDRMDKAIEANGVKITKTLDEKTDGFINQITNLAKENGMLNSRVTALENWKTNMWTKIMGISFGMGSVMALIGYLIGGGHLGH